MERKLGSLRFDAIDLSSLTIPLHESLPLPQAQVTQLISQTQ